MINMPNVMTFYPKLRKERKKRQNQRASARYRRRHPTHKQKYGHRFMMNTAYSKENPVCKICGMGNKKSSPRGS